MVLVVGDFAQIPILLCSCPHHMSHRSRRTAGPPEVFPPPGCQPGAEIQCIKEPMEKQQGNSYICFRVGALVQGEAYALGTAA